MNTWRDLRSLAVASAAAVLVPLGVTVPVLALGTGTAAAAGSIWYVAPGGAAGAPCGATKTAPCGGINVAIGEASPGDTIRVAAGTYTAATAADLVVVGKDLTLTGAGAATTVLDGNQLGTVVTVGSGITATVSGFTIQGGTGTAMTVEDDPAQAGGGVLNQGTLALRNDTVTGNHVTAVATGDGSVNAVGGGVFNADGGTLTAAHDTITGNSASVSTAGAGTAEALGGGISSDATFTSPTSETSVSNSTIDGNTATAAVTGTGSGISAAAGGGVGEMWSASQPDLAKDTITGNKATATGDAGAGAAGAAGAGVAEADSGTANAVSDSTVTGNKAHATTTGGGQATAAAGGIAGATTSGEHAVTGTVVHGNTATSVATGSGGAQTEGGGLAIVAAVAGDAVTTSTITGNTATARSAGAGPAVTLGAALAGAGSGSANAISHSTIERNTGTAVNTGTGNAGTSGAVAAVNSPLVTSKVNDNKTSATASGTNPEGADLQVNVIGGGLALAVNEETGSTASPVNDDTFANNSASAIYSGSGAGIAQVAGAGIGGSTEVTNSTVNNNTAATGASGTGVLLDIGPAARPSLTRAVGQLVARAARVPRLTAGAAGTAGPARLTSMVKGEAGAVARQLAPAHAGTARSGTAHSETAQRRAAGARRDLTADTTVLASAASEGAGIGTLTGPLSNTTVSANIARATSIGLGLAITQAGGIGEADTLVNSTVAGNKAITGGANGVLVMGGGVDTSTSMTNTIVAGNLPSDCGSATGTDGGGNLDSDGSCGLSAANGSVSAGTAGLGPLGHYGGHTETQALLSGSQAIGLGLAATCEQVTGPAGVADTDQRGIARNSAARGVCDSGAYDTGGTP
jgi:hypothetical protein